MTTLKRKTTLNARFTRSQRRFLASIAGKGQNALTDADYAAGQAAGFTMKRPSWGGGKPLPANASYNDVMRCW